MGVTKDIIDQTPRAFDLAAAFSKAPLATLRGPVKLGDALTLLAGALLTLTFTFIVTGLIWFAVLYPDAFRGHMGEGLKEEITANFVIGGSLFFVEFFCALLTSVVITVVARLCGAASGASLFAKVLLVFCLEALVGIPSAVCVFAEEASTQSVMIAVIAVIRLVEVALLLAPLIIAGRLRGIRLALTWGIGVPAPTAIVFFVITGMHWVTLGPFLVKSWD
ncbi:hypothetical protein [Caulobacter sp. RL271]|uniref:Yip1 domain-containing protein n=1 Tax=Caulobacter segnis TaxID=88688 RepID=A0ABY4ZUY4_9CAUL|nr:hypothetical protein [Caulobacter segnis]USQ96525.1 hypothetical protein MZV50_02720 [Caulobacter segnis]